MSAIRNATHDTHLKSWVASANDGVTDFPIQNLPYGRFRRAGSTEDWRIGVAIGDQILDLCQALHAVSWREDIQSLLKPLAVGDLNTHMLQPCIARSALRLALSQALSLESPYQNLLATCLVPQSQAEMSVPCHIGDYTDFYTSIHHATAVGKLFRPDQPLLPNYKWVPIGYHGRASSIGVSAGAFKRPKGQLLIAGQMSPILAPTRRLDYELELAAYVASGNMQGERVSIDAAEDALFGVTLLNDWSARDIQAWEYQPLGPFLSKNFATTVSPWIVSMEALAPFRARFTRPEADPQPLPYLTSQANSDHGAINITLEVWLQSRAMRIAHQKAIQLSQSNYQEAYWTLAQLVAHHTVNGCNLQSGDVLGTGTQSGAQPQQGGSLLELSQGGREPIVLPNGETRTFLEDGDTITLRGYCRQEGAVSIGLGEASATVLPSSNDDELTTA